MTEYLSDLVFAQPLISANHKNGPLYDKYASPEQIKYFERRMVLMRQQFGDGRSTHTRSISAAHEVGHIVTAHILGLDPRSSRIWRNSDYDLWLGSTMDCGLGDMRIPPDTPKAIAEAIKQISGWLGESEIGKVRDLGSSTDERLKAIDILEAVAPFEIVGPSSLINAVMDEVTSLLRKYQDEATTLRRILQRQKKLDRWTIRRVLRGVPIEGYETVVKRILQVAKEKH